MSYTSANEAFEAIAAKNSDLIWLISTWDKASNKLVLLETGSSDLSSFKSKFEDSKILFAVYKVYGVDEHESVTSKRDKLIAISWVGPSVSPLQRNAVLNSKAERDAAFRGCHLSLQFSDLDTLTEADIARQLLASGGAHTPTAYLFGDYKFDISHLKK